MEDVLKRVEGLRQMRRGSIWRVIGILTGPSSFGHFEWAKERLAGVAAYADLWGRRGWTVLCSSAGVAVTAVL